MDLIDRQAAIDEIKRFIGYLDEDMITRLSIAVKRLPTAEKHGKWLRKSGELADTYVCNQCGRKNGVAKTRCCPNCGAKMTEENDG